MSAPDTTSWADRPISLRKRTWVFIALSAVVFMTVVAAIASSGEDADAGIDGLCMQKADMIYGSSYPDLKQDYLNRNC